MSPLAPLHPGVDECVIDGKTKKTPDDLELLENYRVNSEIIEKMKPLMFLMKLQESQ